MVVFNKKEKKMEVINYKLHFQPKILIQSCTSGDSIIEKFLNGHKSKPWFDIVIAF